MPVAYLVLSSETRSINELSDLMLFRVRPILASLPGATAPQPFGGSLRTIVVNLDPERLRAYNLSPEEVAEALNKGNTITPSGNARIKDQMPIVSINSHRGRSRRTWATSRSSRGRASTCATWARVEDSIGHSDRLGPGQRPALDLHADPQDGGRLDADGGQRAEGQHGRHASACCPRTCKLTLEFDQSPYVTGAIGGVVAGIGHRAPS